MLALQTMCDGIKNASFYSKVQTEIDVTCIKKVVRERNLILLHKENEDVVIIDGSQLNLFENELVEVEKYLGLFIEKQKK